MLFDTHAHLNSLDDIPAVLTRAHDAGVRAILHVTTPAESPIPDSARHGLMIARTVGYTPDFAGEKGRDDGPFPNIAALDAAADAKDIRALGEMGLDYHWDYGTPEIQERLLREQLALGIRRGLPVVIHIRDAAPRASTPEDRAFADFFRILRDYAGTRGVLHCFTGSADHARACVDAGLYVSFSGIVTFKNAGAIRDSARVVPDNKIIMETDTPYLALIPHRGKTNEPGFIAHTCAALAEIRGVDAGALAELTFENARRLFGFPSS